jgi:hypothetical protein
MVSRESVSRMLTIRPGDLSTWIKVCRRVNKQVAAAHPESPSLQDMQLLSFVKRLLPEIRAMMSSLGGGRGYLKTPGDGMPTRGRSDVDPRPV